MRYDQVASVRLALTEAERTDESTSQQALDRFVEMRAGSTDLLGSRRHHLLTGRRGTGKSTLLTVARAALRANGIPVAVIDMERFKGRPFPDVLIEIVVTLLDEVRPNIRLKTLIQDWKLRRQFKASRRELNQLLRDPQAIMKKLEKNETRFRERGADGHAGLTGSKAPVSIGLGGQYATTYSNSSGLTITAQFEELKISRLQELASRLSKEFSALVKDSAHDRAVIFIDDFYYVRLDDQPDVLDYLHQVVKGTGIWLKVGGVGARMRPYRGGDPPKGMQPDQDIATFSLDVTLNDFATAKNFLELMIGGVLKSTGVTVQQLFTDGARNRMVLACGGAVARDYLTVASAAIDAAIERISRKAAPNADTEIRVAAEDVNVAARTKMNKKEASDLDLDAGDDAERLRARWRDICDFAQAQGKTAFVLVRRKDIETADWGKEIGQLETLRLLHRVKDTIPNTPNWRGIKCDVFMVDLGQVAETRLHTSIPDFWESTSEFDKLRRAEWVYGPDWKAKLAARQAQQAANTAKRSVEPHPLTEPEVEPQTLFDDPTELDSASQA